MDDDDYYCLTRGKRHLQQQQQQPSGGGREEVRTHLLYIQLHSFSHEGEGEGEGEGDFSTILYKIDPNETGFSKELEPISKLQQLGCGSAICDSSLYMFGGWKHGRNMMSGNKAHYLHLLGEEEEVNKFQPIHPKMKANRAYPKTLTIGEKIYIFGTDYLGLGEVPINAVGKLWAEVFNTKENSFESLNSPPDILFTMPCIGVSVVIEKKNEQGGGGGGHQILIATHNFSDLFIYDVASGKWEHKPTNTISPFPLYSVGSPVVGKYIFLYGNGRVCAFDKDKNQFLKNSLSLLEYAWCEFHDTNDQIHGVIHHLGGWKFCSVFSSNNYGSQVTYLYVVSFEICNPEDNDGELHFKAGSIKVADYVLEGRRFVNSSLWSSQIVHNHGKRPRRMNNLIIGGQSSVLASHVDDDCSRPMDYVAATTSKPAAGDEQDIVGVDYLSDLSKLRRMKTALGKEIHKLKIQEEFLTIQLKVPIYMNNNNNKFERVSGDLNNDDDIMMVDGSNFDDEEEISRLKGETEAQEKCIMELIYKIERLRCNSQKLKKKKKPR